MFTLLGRPYDIVDTINLIRDFGISIKACRKRLGISQEELGERANLHRTYISDIEQGARNVSLESISKLAGALDVSVSSLFTEEILIRKSAEADNHDQSHDLVDILLVEDNPDDVELTLQAFKKARFANRLHVVHDGAEALDYLFRRGDHSQHPQTDRPQLILLDLGLPKMDGLEVLRFIKKDKRTCMIPVVVLTVSQMFADMDECQRLGANSYIVKPVNFQRLSQITPQLSLNWALYKSAGMESQKQLSPRA